MEWLKKIIQKIKELFNPLPQKIANTKPSTPKNTDYIATTTTTNTPKKHKNNITTIPVKNQQSIGSCASHAACMLYEHEIYKKNKVYLEMSELYHYYIARKHINNTYPKDKGMTIIDSLKTGYKHGMCPEKLSPYKIKNYNKPFNENNYIQKSFSQLMKKKYPIKIYYRLINIEDIKQCLSENKLVICGLKIDYNFLRGSYTWKPGGSYKGGHAVVIYGYSEDYFYFRNSWGKRYGSNGNFRAKISDVMIKGFDFMSVEV